MRIELKYKSDEYTIFALQPVEELAFCKFIFDDGNQFTHWYNRLFAIIKFIATGKYEIEMIEDKLNIKK